MARKFPVSTQYKILFKDPCYIFMFLGASQIFGILGAVGGCLVQVVIIWGMSETLGSIMAAICVISGLISSILYGAFLLNYQRQFLLFNVSQLASSVGILVSLLGLWKGLVPVFVVGTLLYSIFTFPSFLIIMEQMGKRVGKEFDLVASGNVFFLIQIITAILLEVFGVILDGKSKLASAVCIFIVAFLLLLNGLFGLLAAKYFQSPFVVQGTARSIQQPTSDIGIPDFPIKSD